MFDNRERKLERLNSGLTDTLSARTYNLWLGICVLYGLIANVILVQFAAPLVENMDYRVFIIGYFVSVIVGSLMSTKSTNPIVSFIGYNLICIPIGLLLAACIPGYDTVIIAQAVMATAIITAVMIAISQIYSTFFEKLGVVLFVALAITIIVELVSLLLGFTVGWIDFVVVVIFSLYIGYDFNRSQRYPKTIDNAIDSAIDIYLDIINIFVRLLKIFSRSKK